jgi:hypothetical protein
MHLCLLLLLYGASFLVKEIQPIALDLPQFELLGVHAGICYRFVHYLDHSIRAPELMAGDTVSV